MSVFHCPHWLTYRTGRVIQYKYSSVSFYVSSCSTICTFRKWRDLWLFHFLPRFTRKIGGMLLSTLHATSPVHNNEASFENHCSIWGWMREVWTLINAKGLWTSCEKPRAFNNRGRWEAFLRLTGWCSCGFIGYVFWTFCRKVERMKGEAGRIFSNHV